MIRTHYAADRWERRNRRCGAVRGCGVLSGTSLRTAICGIYKNSHKHSQTQRGVAAHPSSPRRQTPERVCPVAPCRGRTGPRPEVLEKRSAFGLTGAWRQFLYLTCDTARGQRWVWAYTTRQTHQEALALASATPVQPSLSAPPSVGHCLSSRVPMTDFTFFLTFVIHELLWFLKSPLNWV